MVAAITLYYSSNYARGSDVHWLIRWPWIVGCHCMVVSLIAGLFLTFYFVKPFNDILYGDKLSRSLSGTVERRSKLLKELQKYEVKRMCAGVAKLFTLGAGLAVAGIITLVLGQFGTVLHGVWSPVKYFILLPLRFSKWVLRGVFLRLQSGVHLADRVSRATGRNATKSGALLLAFAKLYGRTLVKFSQSLLIFVIDLATLLLLTAAALLIAAFAYNLHLAVYRLILGEPSSRGPASAHGTHESPERVHSPRSPGTPPPAYETLNGDLPSDNHGKNKRRRRQPPNHKESVEAS